MSQWSPSPLQLYQASGNQLLAPSTNSSLSLTDVYKRQVEIIGLSFERKNDPAFAKTRLEALKNRFGIEYDLLFAGVADKKYASSVLPELSEVLSFPTTIYIDRSGKVTKIHTGYTGSATGAYYEEFVKEFNADMNQLLATEAPKSTAAAGGK